MDDAGSATPETTSDEDLTGSLEAILEDLVSNDPEIGDVLRAEVLNVAEIMIEARAILAEGAFDAISKMQEVKRAEEERDKVFARPDPWYVNVALFAIAIGMLGLLLLLGIGIAKWAGHLLEWPLWPFVSAPLVVLAGAGLILWLHGQGDSGPWTSAAVAVELSRASLNKMLRSLVVIPAIERATSLNLVAPSADTVYLTDAPGLSSRIASGSRIETQSYREVITNLERDGGATIGLAGSRGVGKSELLRAFCDDPSELPSIRSGGVIGINVPAPVAYEAQPFLRVLIHRLAEAVPGYEAGMVGRPGFPSAWGAATLMFAVASLIAGLAFLTGFTTVSRHLLGWALIAISVAAVLILVARFIPSSYFRILGKVAIAAIGWEGLFPLGAGTLSLLVRDATLSIGPFSVSLGRPTDSELRGTLINKEARQALAARAVEVARRIRYVETRSVSSESSASWHNAGFKRTSGVSLDQVPFTEPDLVLELSDLVSALHDGGYRVRIGIDELDKLVRGDEAESFLTGIKVLLSIRDCSFVLTISENAFSQFARRGMPIRDVFDSSLDAVTVVQPLTFEESRRLIRARLSVGYSEKISDTQILLCYCLAGGLPRDFLRFCRQLGEVNSKLGGNAKLTDVMDLLLLTEIRSRIDGVRFALQARDEGQAAALFMAQLELMEKAASHNEVFDALSVFLSNDLSFAELCFAPEPTKVQSNQRFTKENNWISDARRELFTYLYFAETVRGALNLIEHLEHSGGRDSKELVDTYEALADARRRLEMDSAAGWRRTTTARVALGLPHVAATDIPPVSRGLAGEIALSLQRALLGDR
jgi:hypothetical protein